MPERDLDLRATASNSLGATFAELADLELDFEATWFRDDEDIVLLQIHIHSRTSSGHLAHLLAWERDDEGTPRKGRRLFFAPDDGLVLVYTYSDHIE